MTSLYLMLILFLLRSYNIFSLNTELTIQIEAGTVECFYEKASKGEVIDVDYQVIGGGQGKLDVIFKLTSPKGRVLLHDMKEPDNIHSITVDEEGEYQFCWDNSFSHFNAKTVFFELSIENSNVVGGEQWNAEMNVKNLLPDEDYDMKMEDIQGCVERVHVSLHKVRQLQEVKRASEARDRITAEKNLSYVNTWALVQITLMLVVGFVQVVLVRSLFETKTSSKRRFFVTK